MSCSTKYLYSKEQCAPATTAGPWLPRWRAAVATVARRRHRDCGSRGTAPAAAAAWPRPSRGGSSRVPATPRPWPWPHGRGGSSAALLPRRPRLCGRGSVTAAAKIRRGTDGSGVVALARPRRHSRRFCQGTAAAATAWRWQRRCIRGSDTAAARRKWCQPRARRGGAQSSVVAAQSQWRQVRAGPVGGGPRTA